MNTMPPPIAPLTRRRALLGAAAGLATLNAPSARAVPVGSAAPAFTLPGLNAPVSLEALRGQTVLLDFWASWCTPCRLSFPWLGEMQARHGARGLRVVAVNVDRQRSDADAFLARTPARFTLAFDSAGDTPRRYAVKAMPSSFLIDTEGRVQLQHAGFRDDDKPALEAAIAALVSAR